MEKKKNIIKVIALSGFLVFTLFATITNADAAKGSWTSAKGTDWNGLSEVWTTYTGGRNDAETVGLYVRYSRDHSNVGYKSVGCKVDQKVSHMCWGELNRDKYGYIAINKACYHNPGFNE